MTCMMLLQCSTVTEQTRLWEAHHISLYNSSQGFPSWLATGELCTACEWLSRWRLCTKESLLLILL